MVKSLFLLWNLSLTWGLLCFQGQCQDCKVGGPNLWACLEVRKIISPSEKIHLSSLFNSQLPKYDITPDNLFSFSSRMAACMLAVENLMLTTAPCIHRWARFLQLLPHLWMALGTAIVVFQIWLRASTGFMFLPFLSAQLQSLHVYFLCFYLFIYFLITVQLWQSFIYLLRWGIHSSDIVSYFLC